MANASHDAFLKQLVSEKEALQIMEIVNPINDKLKSLMKTHYQNSSHQKLAYRILCELCKIIDECYEIMSDKSYHRFYCKSRVVKLDIKWDDYENAVDMHAFGEISNVLKYDKTICFNLIPRVIPEANRVMLYVDFNLSGKFYFEISATK